ncbi:hypothetical protein Pla100_31530 [Neorhodopirellula pilleata]|uniref:Uncharacterized protein n=1 Tax=Neorhodopirellula pilleata TaxID=2714738 RepID=A0A5C6A6A5_9BACT|nr:hypothetical protein Pla100_31530 [Neorhodopirellula pilleata]
MHHFNFMKLLRLSILVCVITSIVGCGKPEAVNVTENADQNAIDEYNRLNQAAQESMTNDE